MLEQKGLVQRLGMHLSMISGGPGSPNASSDATSSLSCLVLTMELSPWLLQPLPYYGAGGETSQNSWAISVSFLWPVLGVIKSYTRSSPERPWFLKAFLLVSVMFKPQKEAHLIGIGIPKAWGAQHGDQTIHSPESILKPI